MGAAEIIQSILFIAAFGAAFFLFYRKAREIYDNIQMGKPEEIRSSQAFRIKKMVLIALGQKKMFKRPLAAVLHLFIYVAFLFTQIDGLFELMHF